MKIGLIVAIETDSIFEYYKDIEKLRCPKGYELYKTTRNGNEIFILKTGMGEIAASSGTQYLITKHRVKTIVNYGVVGGLTGEMGKEKTCIIKNVIHYSYDCSGLLDLKVGQVDGHKSIFLPTDKKLLKKALEIYPDLKVGNCCSADKFVASAEEKSRLSKTFKGDVCDMESAGVVLTCQANKVPCLMLKAVADGLNDGAKGFFAELKDASFKCFEITDKIMCSLGK